MLDVSIVSIYAKATEVCSYCGKIERGTAGWGSRRRRGRGRGRRKEKGRKREKKKEGKERGLEWRRRVKEREISIPWSCQHVSLMCVSD